MVKLSKFYILFACTALFLFGCGAEKTIPEPEKEPEQIVGEVGPEQIEEEPETENQEAENGPEEEYPEKEYHPIEKDGIDYLSVKGISLEPGVKIAMVASDSGSAFWNAVKKGAQKAVSDLNEELGYSGKDKISLTFTAPKDANVVEQINIIDQLLDKAPDALCIAFTDASASKTQMQMAKNNGIKVIAFDASDEDRLTDALVGTDNKKAEAEAAAKMFDAIGYEGKVAIIVHNSLTQTGMDRKQAIINEFANSYSDKNIRFADIVYLAQEDRSEEEILDELLEENPDLAGIICTDLQTTEMVIDYVGNLETKDFVITGFDVSEKIVGAVQNGTIIGTMSQDPYGMGYATVIASARSIAGMEIAETIYSGYQWIDFANLQSEEAQSLLNY